MNILMLYQALEQYQLPVGFERQNQESWRNAGVRSWRTRLECLTETGVRSLPVWAWAEDTYLHLTVLNESTTAVLGRPGHDPALARHQFESETWSDATSGLMWWRRPCFGPFLTDNPFLIIDDIRRENGIGTFCDWRLPSLDELKTLTTLPLPGFSRAYHPCFEICYSEPEQHLDFYGYRPGKCSTSLADEPAGGSSRVIGYRLPDGVCFLPEASNGSVIISHQSLRLRKSQRSRGIHILGVRGAIGLQKT